DLAAAGCDEAIEEARTHRLLHGVKPIDDLVKVASNNRRRTLEPIEGGKPQHPRALAHFFRPQPLQHQLQERGFDHMRLFTRSTAASPTTNAYLSDSDLLDQPVDQRIFDFDRQLTRRASIVPDGQRLADRTRSALLVEMLEAEPVAEQIGNPLIEAIELRQA